MTRISANGSIDVMNVDVKYERLKLGRAVFQNMSMLKEIGNLSQKRMDDMAVEIVYLKDQIRDLNKTVIDIMERESQINVLLKDKIAGLEDRLTELETNERIRHAGEKKKGAYLKVTT